MPKTIHNDDLIRISEPLLKKSNGLKPCPFCGSDIIRVCFTRDFITEKKLFYVQCMNCEAESGYKQRERDAIDLWENRV